MTALEIDQELVRRPSVNPIQDPASTGEAEVVDWQALRTRDDWRGRVTVGCVVDEENEYRGILKLIEDQAPWDYAVVGEPTDLRGQAVAGVVPYGCDASKLAAAGIPSIIFGPGDIAQAHTKGEFIALTDLEDDTAAYTDLTLKLLH